MVDILRMAGLVLVLWMGLGACVLLISDVAAGRKPWKSDEVWHTVALWPAALVVLLAAVAVRIARRRAFVMPSEQAGPDEVTRRNVASGLRANADAMRGDGWEWGDVQVQLDAARILEGKPLVPLHDEGCPQMATPVQQATCGCMVRVVPAAHSRPEMSDEVRQICADGREMAAVQGTWTRTCIVRLVNALEACYAASRPAAGGTDAD